MVGWSNEWMLYRGLYVCKFISTYIKYVCNEQCSIIVTKCNFKSLAILSVAENVFDWEKIHT